MRGMSPSVTTAAVFLAASLPFLWSCQAPYRPLPYAPKSDTAPQPLVCHDAIGHIRGNRPWILGGNCCCTPTPQNYRLHVAAGTIDSGMSYGEYLELYRAKGIVTDLDHRSCGNLCKYGPHVMLGGKCMATPIVGTAMYERVTFGPHSRAEPPPARATTAAKPRGTD